jgi:hypothetical protein
MTTDMTPHAGRSRAASPLALALLASLAVIPRLHAQGFGQSSTFGQSNTFGQPAAPTPLSPVPHAPLIAPQGVPPGSRSAFGQPDTPAPDPGGQPGPFPFAAPQGGPGGSLGGGPGMAPQPGVPGGGGLSIVGLWSGGRMVNGMASRQTDFFGPDGRFVSVSQLQNGMLLRVWGDYRANQVGQNQMQVMFEVAGSLPRQMCVAAPGYAPQCQPVQIPPTDTVNVTFMSPVAFQAISAIRPETGGIAENRDNNPYLLNLPVPVQEVIAAAPPPQPAPMPSYPTGGGSIGGGGGRYVSPPRGPQCDDLQQRRICNINDGHLVPSGGCLVCVSP